MTEGGARAQALIFVLAGAVMLLEVALTRVFSFITYHHMTYLVIGVGMLGFGAAGTHLTVRKPVPDGPAASARLARDAALFAGTTLVALVAIPKIRFFPMDMYTFGDARNLLPLAAVIVFATAPFFFAGVCIADVLGRAGKAVNRLYFADLAGAACGSLLSIALINGIGALATCVAASALALLGAAFAAPRNSRIYGVAALAVSLLSPVVEMPGVLPLSVPPGKQLHGNEASIEKSTWHSITRLDVGRQSECPCSFGGSLSLKYDGPAPLARLIFQDGSNLTGIIHPTPTPEKTSVLGYYIQGAGFRLRPGARALVIGSGGGVDVMVALHHGARHVVAVDVNPKTMRLVRQEYADFAGNAFNRPDVEPVVAEGRHFLSRDRRTFDVIQLSGVDTWAALSSGAIALTENFIYTTEAFDAYLAHLAPNGILGFSRPFFEPKLETLRLTATALAALERRGITEPHRHLVVLAGDGQTSGFPWAELLVKESPLSAEEIQALTKWATDLDFHVAYDPLVKREGLLDYLVRASSAERANILANYPLNIVPSTDDAPFYFQHHRWKDLLGDHPLGVRPPAAMWVLLASLVEVLLLSALFILYPLRRLRSETGTRPSVRRAGIFGYFASLGLGFILVEIGLLSKLTVFLGGPAYALSITLFTLLLSSGLGSLLSSKRAGSPMTLLKTVLPLAALLILAHAFLLDSATTPLMALPLVGRAAAAVVLIGPLGLLLGTAFPAGLRYLDAVHPDLKPWAWGINACATVVGTTLCMILVTAEGIRASLLVGAAVYVAGLASLLISAPKARDSLAA